MNEVEQDEAPGEGTEEQQPVRRRLKLPEDPAPPPPLSPPPGELARTRLTSSSRRLGHRRVDEDGRTTYKKVVSDTLIGSIQLGIQHAIGGLAGKPKRDLLMQDFMEVETFGFPSAGTSHTPAHHFANFKLKTYAPIAFRYFRALFHIEPDDFLMSMCSAPLRELSNPGASGSIFYLTYDDEFIIKTVQHKEGEFLQKLLPGYYLNLNQNPRTLLPKFFGLFTYQTGGKNIRLIVMNNLLPSHVHFHEKYDLKGSTYGRKASKEEREKNSPTYKDLDFLEIHPQGLFLESDVYHDLISTISRDCRVLESFKIMDYSLLVGIQKVDEDDAGGSLAWEKAKTRVMKHATPMESIKGRYHGEPRSYGDPSPIWGDSSEESGIPAKNAKGERLHVYLGIIDILQSYKFRKKLEHAWKSLIYDGNTVSVHRPDFYSRRFLDFMSHRVFKEMPGPPRGSTSKRKSSTLRLPLTPVLPPYSAVAIPSTSRQPPPPHSVSTVWPSHVSEVSSSSGIGSSSSRPTSASQTHELITNTTDVNDVPEKPAGRHVTRILLSS